MVVFLPLLSLQVTSLVLAACIVAAQLRVAS